jgi:hypothetical protein
MQGSEELLCDVRFPEPVSLRRYIDLVTDRTPEERLPNSYRHKRIVSPPKHVEAVCYSTYPSSHSKNIGSWGILTQCKMVWA